MHLGEWARHRNKPQQTNEGPSKARATKRQEGTGAWANGPDTGTYQAAQEATELSKVEHSALPAQGQCLNQKKPTFRKVWERRSLRQRRNA